jgi:hypothetical protein
VSIYASIEGIGDHGDPEHLGQPWVYQGSHILPDEDHPRAGAIGLALIPSQITRGRSDTDPDDGPPHPWLRLSIDITTWTEDPALILNPTQARHLAAQLNAWADQAEGRTP